MYHLTLTLHSWLRWGVVLTLLVTLLVSLTGWLTRRPYTRSDAALRSLTTSVAHLQLLVGFALYFQSPIATYFRENPGPATGNPEVTFFGIIHVSMMLVAVVVLTLGSSLGKRAATDARKHRTVALCFLAGAVLILLAIPWPFSPLAKRPLLRAYAVAR
ncbi:MAG: hypothetical protein ICV83_19195 [Cytophagales bacterium]|nr:hypothetical protein [Cytophagales bacterium]